MSTATSWRAHCRAIISKVIAANAGRPDLETRAAIGRAYPYGPRMAAANAAWRAEIAAQLNPQPASEPAAPPTKRRAPATRNPDQAELEL